MHWKEEALNHAKKDYPRESVGLLLNVKGKEKYFACNNLAIETEEDFVLDPRDYVKAEDTGQIIAVIHSHPKTAPRPSQADLISCEHTKMRWYIVNPSTEEWGYCEPTGYKHPLLGRVWVWGMTDCWALVVDWYKEEKGIILKDYDRSMTPLEFLKNPLFEKYAEDTGFIELKPDEALQTGDVLLMSIMHPTLNHVAIFLGDMVLHHLRDRLSCKEPYSEWLLKCTGKRYRYAQKS
jgi:proteasome lid subunit RPN8/RPN11